MELVISILATYGLTILLVEKDGPYGVFYKLRKIKPLGALKCVTCTSAWIGAVIALYTAENALQWLLITLALIGSTTILDRLTNHG